MFECWDITKSSAPHVHAQIVKWRRKSRQAASLSFESESNGWTASKHLITLFRSDAVNGIGAMIAVLMIPVLMLLPVLSLSSRRALAFTTGESARGFCVQMPYPSVLWERRDCWHSLTAFAFGRLKSAMSIMITAGGTAAEAVGIM